MKKIQNWAALFFIGAVVVLCIVSIFGVWDFLKQDVITKSFETLGLLATVAAIVIIGATFAETKSQTPSSAVTTPDPIFKTIRQFTVTALITSVSLLALIGILSIWDVASADVLHRSIGSIAIIAFSTVLIVITALSREGDVSIGKDKNFSVGTIILMLIIGYFIFSLSHYFFFW